MIYSSVFYTYRSTLKMCGDDEQSTADDAQGTLNAIFSRINYTR